MHRHRPEPDNQRNARRAPGRLTYALALGLLAIGVQPVTAADSEAKAAAGLEEVVVTARYTNESVQNTPLSIVSLTADRLEKEGITSLLDTAQTTSGVTFVSGGGPYLKSLGATIRGVGQRDFIPALQPGIGVYVDDVYLGSIVGSSAELGDVERVEILKGPQGTLFGRNNEGGAVRVFNKKPVGDNSGIVELGFGDYDQRRVKASIDAHLSDQLFMRLTASTRKARGHVEQIDFACARPAEAGNIRPIAINGNCLMGYAGSEDVNYYRAAFRWMPSSNLEINVMGDSMTNYGTPPADRTAYISPSGILQLANQNVNIPTYGIPVDSRFIAPNFYQVYTTNATYTDPITGVGEEPVDNVATKSLTGTVDWDAPGGVHVKFIAGWRSVFDNTSFKQGGGPIWVAGVWNKFDHDQKSAELNISGKALGDKVDWVGGLYYYKGSEHVVGPVNISAISEAFGLPSPFIFTQDNHAHSDAKSAFVHAVVHATDRFDVEAGVRYTKENLSYQFDQDPYFDPSPTHAIGSPFTHTPPLPANSSHTDPKLALQYRWNDNLMTYVSGALGFKGGGFNPRPLDPADAVAFKPEYLTQYEIGEKSEWFDHRLRVNLAGYYSIYKDLQINARVGTPPRLIYTNVGKARVTGVELDLEAEPNPHWLFTTSVGTVNFKYLELGAAAGTGPTLDTKAPGVPDFKGSATAQFSWGFLGGTAAIRGAFTYQSNVYWDDANTAPSAQGGYGLLNGRLSWSSGDNLWEAALQGNNLLGKEYYSMLNNDVPLWGTVVGTVGKPRQLLFTVSRKFGGK